MLNTFGTVAKQSNFIICSTILTDLSAVLKSMSACALHKALCLVDNFYFQCKVYFWDFETGEQYGVCCLYIFGGNIGSVDIWQTNVLNRGNHTWPWILPRRKSISMNLISCFMKQLIDARMHYMIGFNSLRPSDAYTRQKTEKSLVQIVACRLVGATPLSEPMLEYCYLDRWEQTSNFIHFNSRRCIWKSRLQNDDHLSRPQYVKN